MTRICSVTAANFEQEVKAKAGVVVLRFWATWCGPCIRMKPLYREIADEMAEQAAFGEVDIDQAPELGAAFGIRSVPSLIILKDGMPVDGMVGLAPKSQYVAMLKKHLSPA